MLVAGIANLYAQGHRGGHHHRDGHRAVLTGKVASSEGGVIDFATVYLKGTSYGATTDAEGRYTLKAPAGEYTLVVSAIGYQTVEQALTLGRGERSAKDWTLRPDVQQLEEVVVVSSGVTRHRQEPERRPGQSTRHEAPREWGSRLGHAADAGRLQRQAREDIHRRCAAGRGGKGARPEQPARQLRRAHRGL